MARDKLVLTYQDYLRMPEDGNRREILGGDLYVTPAPTPAHQLVVGRLFTFLVDYVERRRLGRLYLSPVDVVLSDINVVQPDLVFVAADRLDIVTSTVIQGSPDLVIEVLSPSTARVDRGRKMETYARFAVREYWIVDPDARTLQICRLEGDAYHPLQRSLLFPDLTYAPQSLWD